MFTKKNSIGIVIALFMMLLSASCSSSKKSVVTNIDKNKIVVADKKMNKKLYKEVDEWLGVPYKYGGQSKKGTDCSGLVVEIYKEVYGIKLYRSSSEIYEKNCKKIKKSDLKEGDLVFFITSKNEKKINHVGLYLKDDKFVHTSTKKGVIISELKEPYYESTFFDAGRVISH